MRAANVGSDGCARRLGDAWLNCRDRGSCRARFTSREGGSRVVRAGGQRKLSGEALCVGWLRVIE